MALRCHEFHALKYKSENVGVVMVQPRVVGEERRLGALDGGDLLGGARVGQRKDGIVVATEVRDLPLELAGDPVDALDASRHARIRAVGVQPEVARW